MSDEQSEVYDLVTTMMDRKENKFLKWALAFLFMTIATIAAAAFTLGIKLEQTLNKVNSISFAQEVSHAETVARISDWTAWRKTMDDRAAHNDATSYTRDDHDIIATIFNMRTQPAMMPYYFEVKSHKGP